MAELGTILVGFGLAMDAQGLALKTRLHYLYDLGGFVGWLEGDGLGDWKGLTRDHVLRYVLHFRETGGREGKGRADKTVREATLSIKKLISWLTKEGEIPTDVAANIKLPAAQWKAQPSYTAEEIAKLIAACSAYTKEGVRDKALLLFMADSGPRVSDLVSMSELDLVGGTVIVNGKGGQRRTAFTTPTAQAIDKMLRRWGIDPAKGPYFRSLKGGAALSESGVYQILKRLCKLTGVTMKGTHGMRRASATLNKARGMSDSTLLTNLGWRSPVMLLRYLGESAEAVAKDEWQGNGNGGAK